MSDPLALVPFALAAAGGRLNNLAVSQVVAAGVTLLQRCAPLVQALSGRRGAALLPLGAEWLCALAACDGHGMVWLDPAASGESLERDIAHWQIGALFVGSPSAENSARAVGVAASLPTVSLDHQLRWADVTLPSRAWRVDLGSHFGIPIEGTAGIEGRDEECLIVGGQSYSHRELLQRARSAPVAVTANSADVPHATQAADHARVQAFITQVAIPLLDGATLP